jgi:signal transduction histidine kinase/ligand-binding sensor domain-containing protein
MKRSSSLLKMIPALAGVLWMFVSILGVLSAQEPQVSPAASPSPLVSPSTTPVRVASPTPLPGAQNFHRWGSITVFNGLPSDSIKAIAQTPDGVMWFGTDNGLARFDGRRVQNFSLGEGDSNRILVMKTDAEGRIWIGTEKGAFIFSQSRAELLAGTENVGIQSILLGDEMYLGSDSGFAYRVSELNGARRADQINPEQLKDADANPVPITGIVKDNGRLLIATYGRGVFGYRDGRLSELPSTPRPIFVNSLVLDSSGKVWLGTDANKGISGIYRLDETKAVRITAPTANVWPISIDETGVWAGTSRYGLFHLVNGKLDESFSFENTSGGLRSNTVFSIFSDREGVVWLGTNRGVSRYDPLGPFQQTVSDSPNSNFIRTFWRSGDGRSLYAGSNRGLFELDGGKWKEVPGFGNRVVYSVGSTSNGVVVGTPSGAFDPNGRLLTSGDVRSLESLKGDLYAAVYGRGVVRFRNGSQDVVWPDGSPTSLMAGQNGLWIGTDGNGLFKYDGNQVVNVLTSDVLKSGTIWKMCPVEDPGGGLYIAGQHGVFLYRNDSVQEVVRAEDVRDVYVDGKDVWAATTSQGLLHVRRDDRFGWIVSPIGFEQGLPSEKAFAVLPMSGYLLVATNRGVVRLYTKTTPPKLIPVRILSQRLHDLNEIGATIALDYPQNSLLIEVAGQSSRTFPEEFQYAFLLKNSKGETVDQKFSINSQYNPTELNPGEYTIESIVFDRDLNQSEPLSIKFSVAKAPFPWTASALGVLLAIAVIGLVWAVFEHRRIRQRNRELAAARFELANEAERERSRIARDLHDQTLADLRLLMMRSDKGDLSQPELRHEIESVSTEIRRICEDLSPSVLENVGLVPALEFLLSQTIENNRFSADDGIEERLSFSINAQLQIYRIAQEVLANIRRHSNADEVEMKVAAPDGRFDLTITDNGTAFEPDSAMGKGRGITNIRSRANLVGGRASWKERTSGGNVFTLRVPRE